MDQLYIHRAHARFHLPPAQHGEQARLSRLLERARQHDLPAALSERLAALGVREEEQICIRRVHSRVELPLHHGDGALAVAWADALVRAICAALEHTPAGEQELVRYPSRQAARLDVIAGLLHGQLERAWAWRQLGLWSEDRTQQQALFEALAEEPRAIAQVLRVLVQRGLAARLSAALPTRLWARLAAAQVRAAGCAEPLVREILQAEHVPAASEPPSAERKSRVSRILRGSLLVQLPCAGAARAGGGPSACALAALILCEQEPAALRAPQPFRRLWLDVAAALLPGEDTAPEAPRPAPGAELDDRAAVAPAHDSAAVHAKMHGEPAGREDVADRPDRAEAEATAGAPGPDPAAAQEPYRAVRASGRTRYAGLLFLIRLLAELDLPAELDALAERCGEPVRVLLARLGRELLPIDAEDPALLAFCGLAPDAPSPLRGVPRSAPEEIASALSAWAAKVRARVDELLAVDGPSEPPGALLQWLCERPAEIIADPGWIEVRLPGDAVDTRIRRVGLDLDPNYVTWLGVVVRFYYA